MYSQCIKPLVIHVAKDMGRMVAGNLIGFGIFSLGKATLKACEPKVFSPHDVALDRPPLFPR